MLQQTQVKTVIPYFKNFIKKFPSQKKLSEASEDQVLAAWSGLGILS
jgi:A/G-specific adenine glycosylase